MDLIGYILGIIYITYLFLLFVIRYKECQTWFSKAFTLDLAELTFLFIVLFIFNQLPPDLLNTSLNIFLIGLEYFVFYRSIILDGVSVHLLLYLGGALVITLILFILLYINAKYGSVGVLVMLVILILVDFDRKYLIYKRKLYITQTKRNNGSTITDETWYIKRAVKLIIPLLIYSIYSIIQFKNLDNSVYTVIFVSFYLFTVTVFGLIQYQFNKITTYFENQSTNKLIRVATLEKVISSGDVLNIIDKSSTGLSKPLPTSYGFEKRSSHIRENINEASAIEIETKNAKKEIQVLSKMARKNDSDSELEETHTSIANSMSKTGYLTARSIKNSESNLNFFQFLKSNDITISNDTKSRFSDSITRLDDSSITAMSDVSNNHNMDWSIHKPPSVTTMSNQGDTTTIAFNNTNVMYILGHLEMNSMIRVVNKKIVSKTKGAEIFRGDFISDNGEKMKVILKKFRTDINRLAVRSYDREVLLLCFFYEIQCNNICQLIGWDAEHFSLILKSYPETLETFIQNSQLIHMDNYSSKHILVIMVHISRALVILHQNHIIHRDIKLANIFVERDNTGSNEINTVLGDFGLSMITDSGLKEYQSQMATFNFENPAGSSPFYAPPEYHMAFKKKNFQYLDPHKPMSGDIYSLGIVLSCCILRKTPQRLNFGADIKNR